MSILKKGWSALDYCRHAIDKRKENFYSGFLLFLDEQKTRKEISEESYQQVQKSLRSDNVKKTLLAGSISEIMNFPVIWPLGIALTWYLTTLDIDISSKWMILIWADRLCKIALAYPIAKTLWVTHAKTFAALKVVPSAGVLPVLGALRMSDPEFVKYYALYKKEKVEKILMHPALQSGMRVMV